MAVLKNARILQMNATIVYGGVYVAEGQLNGAFWHVFKPLSKLSETLFFWSLMMKKCYLCFMHLISR